MSDEKNRELTNEEIESVVGGLPGLAVDGNLFKCDRPDEYIGHEVTFRIDGKVLTGTVSGVNPAVCSSCTFRAKVQVTRTKTSFFGLIKKHYTDWDVYTIDPGNLISFKE